MSTTTPHPAPALLFYTSQALDDAVDATGIRSRLRDAVTDSSGLGNLEPCDRRHHCGAPVATGINFTAALPPAGKTGTSGTVIITGDGSLTVRIYDVPCSRLAAALSYFGGVDPHRFGAAVAAGRGRRPWATGGVLLAQGRVQAHAFFDTPNAPGDNISTAMLTLSPLDQDAWLLTWQHGVGFLRTLTTGMLPQT